MERVQKRQNLQFGSKPHPSVAFRRLHQNIVRPKLALRQKLHPHFPVQIVVHLKQPGERLRQLFKVHVRFEPLLSGGRGATPRARGFAELVVGENVETRHLLVEAHRGGGDAVLESQILRAESLS